MIDNEIFNRIALIKWFSNCGKPISSNTKFDIIKVNAWEDAKMYYSEPIWEDTTSEAQNELTSFLHKKYRNDYGSWNKVAAEGKVFIESTIKPKLIEVKEANELGKVFIDCVMWDLLGAIMEFYYGKYKNRPEFFLELLKIYQSGNFPCGWVGHYPKGNLVVF